MKPRVIDQVRPHRFRQRHETLVILVDVGGHVVVLPAQRRNLFEEHDKYRRAQNNPAQSRNVQHRSQRKNRLPQFLD